MVGVADLTKNYINSLTLDDYFTVSPARVASFSQKVTFLDEQEVSSVSPKIANIKLQPPTIQFSVTTNAPTLEERNAAMALLQAEIFKGFMYKNNYFSAPQTFQQVLRLKELGNPIRDVYFDGDFVVERGVDYARADLTFVAESYALPQKDPLSNVVSISNISSGLSYFDVVNEGTAPCPLKFSVAFKTSGVEVKQIQLAVLPGDNPGTTIDGNFSAFDFETGTTGTAIVVDTAASLAVVERGLNTYAQPWRVLHGGYPWLTPGKNRVIFGVVQSDDISTVRWTNYCNNF